MRSVLVIVPTYNEAANIGHAIDEIRTWLPTADILVVDDNSPDGTGQIVQNRAAEDGAVRLLHRPDKAGLGAAYRAGFAYALDAGYTSVVEMDADGSHPAEALPALIAGLDHADLVLGSRWIGEGRTERWPWNRIVLSRCANWYARHALGSSVKDVTSGFRAFRASTLLTIDVAATTSNGYCFQIETLHLAELAGLTTIETPITFTERLSGHSKMNPGIMLEAFSMVTKWAWQGRRRRPVRSSSHVARPSQPRRSPAR